MVDSILSDLDFGSLYPNSLFNHMSTARLIGTASILVNTTGDCKVAFSNNSGSIQEGDMVIDPTNGRQAVYCGDKWTWVA